MAARQMSAVAGVGVGILVLATLVGAQGPGSDLKADYDRANALRDRVQNKIYNVVETPTWIEKTSKLWYRKSVKGGNEFVLVDAAAPSKGPAFDHEKLAAALSTAAKAKYTAVTLPFTSFTFVDEMKAIEFTIGGGGRGGAGRGAGPGAPGAQAPALPRWRCTLTDYQCTRLPAPPPTEGRAAGLGQGRGGAGPPGAQAAEQPQVRVSPDGKTEALIQNFNVCTRPAGSREAAPITWDGSEGDAYVFNSIAWAPDSRKIAALRRRPGYRRVVNYVQSSPTDQLQPKLSSNNYQKPGDVVDRDQPVLINLDTKQATSVNDALFPNAYSNGRIDWRKDSRAFTFEYNQRGHQVYRIIEVDAATGAARTVIEETSLAFIDYRRATAGMNDSGHQYRFDVADGQEVIWMSERDGTTDIWGVIVRPTNFDPKKKYPVIESIYAGPQGSFVPKTFSTQTAMQTLAELGFIVVQIDGMGTTNRSKAFHDVAWKNLGDAGFPDRILWHKAVAAKYPYYDILRVGVYGTSAGGQNAMGAVLFHPEFYKAAAASSGCHDNRMDKIWWNEQWMGWPLGPEFAASSNMENASKLRGNLLLIYGEMDTNVDPSSTMQVVNRLIQANRNFELVAIPNAGHTNGGAYGDHKRFDFFVRYLRGVEPPLWSALAPPQADPGATVSVLDEPALPWVAAEDWDVTPGQG